MPFPVLSLLGTSMGAQASAAHCVAGNWGSSLPFAAVHITAIDPSAPVVARKPSAHVKWQVSSVCPVQVVLPAGSVVWSTTSEAHAFGLHMPTVKAPVFAHVTVPSPE